MRKETYSMLDAMLASPTEPMPLAKRTYQLTRMWSGLAALETSPEPTQDDWAVCSDAVNLMETLIEGGQVDDTYNLLFGAMKALAEAEGLGKLRHHQGGVAQHGLQRACGLRGLVVDGTGPTGPVERTASAAHLYRARSPEPGDCHPR